ncbi:MAG: undecaprenyldiphospho-muramoylpentapeptide beta-N-acetylglucosaminyltransferase [Pelomonas sp.]|nr:undecaprenyldiphospho-muramoylpentapeptide beta-N-acetylglucosaminyltransferase [Roseateles sp.]
MTRHLVIMAAGTGGHIIPGIAVAREMERRGWSVSWIGTETGMENRLVPAAQLPLDRLAFGGLRGKGLAKAFKGLAGFARAFVQSRSVFVTRHADAVLGMGGYVCAPGGLMAWLMRRPLVLVNADASWLMSNKWLARFARRICFGFDGRDAATLAKAVVTGNPVRGEIESLPAPAARYAERSGPLRLLVLGGSLGAKALNDALPAALALWPADARPSVVHQCGQAHLPMVQQAYRDAGLTLGEGVEVLAFIDDMAAQLAAADLVVCRAGAITVSELCAAGVPAVLVPLVVRTTSHQRDNAQFMAQHGAALHLPQGELSAEKLFSALKVFTRQQLLEMAEKAQALARPRAAARVADAIEASLEVRT